MKQIALWPEYESFRAAALLFFLGENALLLFVNVGFLLRWSIAPLLSVAAFLLAIVAAYQATVFVQRAKSHFTSQPKVIQAMEKSKEKLAEQKHWAKFLHTVDGRLFVFTTLQLALAATQLWFTLH